MMTRTGLIICIAVTALGIYDLWQVFVTGTGGSISDWLVNAGFKAPFASFAFGYLAGHLFSIITPIPPK